MQNYRAIEMVVADVGRALPDVREQRVEGQICNH